MPLYNVGIGFSWEFPYTNGAFSFGTQAFPTFTQQASTSAPYTNKVTDAFIGMKSGVELSVTNLTLPLTSLFGVGQDYPLFNGRTLAAGVYDIIGPYGSLSLNVTPPIACFKWDLAPRVQAMVEATIAGNPIASLSGNPVLVPGVQFDGAAGCGNVTVSVMANPTSVQAGGSVALTATMAVPSGDPAPTGNVTFVDQSGAVLCSSVVMGSPGSATCPATINTTATSDAITANYSGDSNYPPSNGATTVTVSQTGSVAITSASCVIETPPPPGPPPYNYFATEGITVTGTATGVVGSRITTSSTNFEALPFNPTCSAWTNCTRQSGEPATTGWTASYTTVESIDTPPQPPLTNALLFEVDVGTASATNSVGQTILCQ